MSLLLNILWIVFGGFWMTIGWLIASALMAVTISVHALSNLLQTVAAPATAGIPSGLSATGAGGGGANP